MQNVRKAILAFFLIRNRILEKIQLEKEKSELESKALQAQMNPHFTYNAMNSIQSLISSKDFYNAELYLAKFSTLLRNSLEQSRVSKISLAQEIEGLKTYLHLENLRFPDNFEYTFTVDKNIETEFIYIPPMILQPFLENCIVHGFSQLNRKGIIKINFKEITQQNIIECSIEDNGKGRKKRKLVLRESLGTKIVKQRLHLINKEPNNNPIHYLDLVDNNGTPCGTKVIIKIPIL